MRDTKLQFTTITIALILVAACRQSDPVDSQSNRVNNNLLDGGLTANQVLPTEEQSRIQLASSIAQSIATSDTSILILGNSHSSSGNLLGQLKDLLHQASPDANIFVHNRRGRFLADIAKDEKTFDVLSAGPWDVLILQAQKYSTSGTYVYPTDAAEKLGRIARKQATRVIMFPEWPRRGNDEEGPRIHRLHQSIAKEIDAAVAPVGLAWMRALEKDSKLNLYAVDGNHSSEAGACLTAAVLFCQITNTDPAQLPTDSVAGLNDDQVRLIRQIAWQTYQANQTTDQ